MPYRRTASVTRRLAARQEAILTAARALAAEAGLAAVQIAQVAERAGIAAGTVYRYFPSKTELIAALVGASAQREILALSKAADAAPGPLSALAAAIATLGARALAGRRLTYALIAEPLGHAAEAARLQYRRDLTDAFEQRIRAALAAGHLPAQDAAIAARALIGALIEGLAGPLAPDAGGDPERQRATVQALTLFGLRGLGVVDARARGLVVQTRVSAPT